MKLYEVYDNLLKKHGNPAEEWSIWCKRPKTNAEKEAIIIESILTQRAGWKNVKIAVTNLVNANVFTLKGLLSLTDEQLQTLIRPSGFYRTKTVRLKNLANFILNKCGGINKTAAIEDYTLRESLLSLNGIGDETADDILLYAFEKPFFVIDEYTRRLVKKLHLSDNLSYSSLQRFFEEGLGKKDYALYQDFHALIVMEGKDLS